MGNTFGSADYQTCISRILHGHNNLIVAHVPPASPSSRRMLVGLKTTTLRTCSMLPDSLRDVRTVFSDRLSV
jgi:hypothetical protein